MKAITVVLVALLFGLPSLPQNENQEAAVQIAIRAFYKAFNDGFVGPADYATEDWNHINPAGGRTRSRVDTLKEVREVHQSFLKGAIETIENVDVRFATPDVAVGTVVSLGGGVTTPDGVKHGPGRSIRTFVLVRRDGRWQIMQDQNTFIQSSQ